MHTRMQGRFSSMEGKICEIATMGGHMSFRLRFVISLGRNVVWLEPPQSLYSRF